MILGPLASNLFLAAAGLPSQTKHQEITPSPAGPFHVSGNRILDAHNRPFLMRGTQLTPFSLATLAFDNRSGDEFGSHSATSLSAIRLRFNMNTVRLPLNVLESAAPDYFSSLAKVVRRANDIDLLVILAAREPGSAMPTGRTAQFWARCAAVFKDYPNVMFDAFSDPAPETWNTWPNSMQSLVSKIRSTGAAQPIVVMAWNGDRALEDVTLRLEDPNIIYEASLRFLNTRTDAQRDAHIGNLSDTAPVIANGWDLELDNPSACAAVPSDPGAAAAMVQGNLEYFDAHQISWIVSTFEPGKLINDLSLHDATTLENGWTCGQPIHAGLGRIVEGHLRASEERGLFVVSGSGGPDVARGALSLAYGPVMAAYDAYYKGPKVPTSLGGISIQITDSLGITHSAGMLWSAAGWGQTNFVVPQEAASGPAVMTIVRDDGTRTSTYITVGETAPGFMTGESCRGPAIGIATETFKDGRIFAAPISYCRGMHCRALPIPMAKGATTKVRLRVSGFRHAGSKDDIEVSVAGMRVPVLAYGADKDPGMDYLTIEIPAALGGLGETDIVSHIAGRPSNAVRINLGGPKPVS
jgi:uncharacterized protein (TIGR03437 family)